MVQAEYSVEFLFLCVKVSCLSFDVHYLWGWWCGDGGL